MGTLAVMRVFGRRVLVVGGGGTKKTNGIYGRWELMEWWGSRGVGSPLVGVVGVEGCCDLTFRALFPNLEHLYIIEVLTHANATRMFKRLQMFTLIVMTPLQFE